MPKFPKAFGRRKSNTITFEEGPETPVEAHTFKVFERPDSGGSRSFDGGAKLARAPNGTNGLVGKARTVHLDDDNIFSDLGKNRGSGASNTNTASTTDSSRLSAASTAPSSTDAHGREEWKLTHDKPLSDIPIPPIPKSSSGFSLKHAGRSLSWGRKQHFAAKEPKSPASGRESEEDDGTSRPRAMTASSYASTATPPKIEDKNLGLSLGGDFSDMFSGFAKRKSVAMEAEKKPGSLKPAPVEPGTHSFSFTHSTNEPLHLDLDKNKEIEAPPYSWHSQHSSEGLMSSTSPPPVPAHGSPPRKVETLPFNRPQNPNAPSGLRRTSAMAERRHSTLKYGDAVDEDAALLQESLNASRRLNDPSFSSKVRDSWALPLTSQYKVDDATLASWVGGSAETTPKARKAVPKAPEDNMFDSQIAASANVAQRFSERTLSMPGNQGPPRTKVMTPAQFERYRQDQDRLRSVGGQSKDDEDDEEEEPYEDEDEDEAERNKQLAKQRRKQEAHMAVYRQQMMKVTGEAPTAIPRPTPFATQSSPNLASLSRPEEGEEEDEEVPLAILQAHGFPNKNKPPMRSMGSNPNLRSSAMSTAGGVVDPRLPVFARNLPQDPYFGAGIVAPMNRESMAFGGGAGSVSGAPSRSLPPGGLVGVIATEERSRAMRRGSPNPQTGEYGPTPPSGLNSLGMGVGMGMQPPSGGSMYNGMGPAGPMGMTMGPMGPMPMMMTPGDQAQIQMSQQMQQFMQMQMQFMQMMTNGQGQPQQNGNMPQNSFDMQRPGSAQQMRPQTPTQQQRAMSILDPNVAPWMQHGNMYAPSIHAPGGYAPSIAPSERSNIGLPGRYRPVSHAPAPDTKSRASTMSGALGGWEQKNGASTIRPIATSGLAVEDDDDEEAWAEMAKKREKKKSLWRTKKDKDSNGLKEMLNYA